ncbi:MAG TPA: WhiB family transcriptional regulator [Arachnia sp.]|nr:WhiB family transcriptional regulator [Arachnia sp.]HMT87170.1 WhiB family transcriptional regulator [Arachnia sp.]
MSAHVSAAARAEARRALADALAALKTPTPCQGADRDNWTSDDPDVLSEAAVRCAPCPVREACRVAGRGEHWGAWGGRVYGRTPGPAQPRPTPTGPPPAAAATPATRRAAGLALLAAATRADPVTPAQLVTDAADLGLRLTPSGLGHVLRTAEALGHIDRRLNSQGRTVSATITDVGRAEAERLALELWP